MKLIDIENIDYVRLEDSLHCLEHHKGDEVECVICAPTVEAIPKADYENRLKADMVAMLDKIYSDIQKLRGCSCSCSDGIIDDVEDILDKYKGETEE